MNLQLLAFVVGYFGLLGMSLVRGPIWGIYAYLMAFYLHPPSRWWGASLPDLRWSLLAAAVALLSVLIHRADKRRPAWISDPISILVLCYVLLMWLQIPWVLDRQLHGVGLELLTKYLVIMFLMYRVCDTEERVKLVLLAHVAGCFYLGYLALGTNVDGRLDGIGGPGINNANTLGMQLATALIIAAMLILNSRDWTRWAALLMTPFIVNALILTETRGAFVGLLAGGLALMYLRPNVNTRLFYAFAALGMVLFAWLAQDYFWERMASVTAAVERTEQIDSSAESRIYIIEAQWRMALDYPQGVGFRGTATLSSRYMDQRWLAAAREGEDESDRARSSHNTFMSTLVEQGFVGAMLYLALCAYVFTLLVRLRRLDRAGLSVELGTYRAALGAAWVVVLVAGLFTDYLNAEVQYWLLAMLTAVAQLSRSAVGASATAASDRAVREVRTLQVTPQAGTGPPPQWYKR